MQKDITLVMVTATTGTVDEDWATAVGAPATLPVQPCPRLETSNDLGQRQTASLPMMRRTQTTHCTPEAAPIHGIDTKIKFLFQRMEFLLNHGKI
jgi:hypothetical protein